MRRSILLGSAGILAAVLVGCVPAGPPARSASAYFESRIDAESRELDVRARELPERKPLAMSARPTEAARLAQEACASIPRTNVMHVVDLPSGARLVLTPYDRGDLDSLQRRVAAFEDANDTERCTLPGILRSAEYLEIMPVAGRLHVDLVVRPEQRAALRQRVRAFAADAANYGFEPMWRAVEPR